MNKDTDKKRILLVDDDEFYLTITSDMLQEDYDIIIAKSGKEAIDFFYKGIFPDLILLDILMPNMDGWETYNRLKAMSFLQNIPIAFLTSVTGTDEKNFALEIGAADFITKPYEEKELLRRVKKILEKKKVKDS